MTKVLVVCTGNICRSPIGHIVLGATASSRGIELEVDSAGTTSYEAGNPIDPRARTVLENSGYQVPRHVARQVRSGELDSYDLVLAMTAEHQSVLRRRALNDGARTEHIRLWREFDPAAPAAPSRPSDLDVVDPWYGDYDDFVETLEMVESAIDGILEHLNT